MKHGEVSHSLFPGYPIHSITNGVHAVTWAAPSFQALYDRHLPDWRRDQLSLWYAIGIPGKEVWDAHMEAKRALIEYVNRETNAGLDRDVFTLGFARRAVVYKRGPLVFHDLDRLKKIVEQAGPLQIVFGGKAHPHDHEGKEMIRMGACHAAALYDKLGGTVMPCFYKERERFVDIMRHTIALNGGFFNTQRMVDQYLHNAYRMAGRYIQTL